MKRTVIAAITAFSLFGASAAMAKTTCIDWNGIVLCGEEMP